MRHIIPISGKDSLATALLQTTRFPDLPYEYIFCDTGAELPETYEWLNRVESTTGWKIERVGEDLRGIIRGYGGFLPSPRMRYCTRKGKIKPMEDYLGDSSCVIYYGLRADEERTGYVPVAGSRITPSYPLKDMNIDLNGVFIILDAQNLMPPDFRWLRLYEAVKKVMDRNEDDWEDRLTRVEKIILFSGRTRGNCSFCFFQRQYEFVWLMETHPDLFAEAKALENDRYSLQSGYFLRDLESPERRDKIFNRRVKQVSKLILDRFTGLGMGDKGDNDIAATSCGLLCGK